MIYMYIYLYIYILPVVYEKDHMSCSTCALSLVPSEASSVILRSACKRQTAWPKELPNRIERAPPSIAVRRQRTTISNMPKI